MTRRRSKRPRVMGRLAEPRNAQRSYMRALLGVSRDINAIILSALEPLIAVWPEPRRDRRELSDAVLHRLWPSLSPDDVRAFAPWATSPDAVERILTTAGRPIVGADLEDYVRAAIAKARAATAGVGAAAQRITLSRAPGAFRIIRRGGTVAPEPPVILGPNGLPIGPPPVPMEVTRTAITEQLSWARLNIGGRLRHEELSPILDAAGEAVSRHTAREFSRVMAIDVRKNLPGINPLINGWRDANVRLIESGAIGPMDGVQLRPLLTDVSEIVEDAHAKGLRVEELAGQLQERFSISNRRAELIARDQTLKLNGQIQQHRQREAGITQYMWRAVGDERTRPRHMELDGTLQSWDSPPEVAPGRFEHPGGDYQCRCAADPILPDWLE